MVKLVDKELYAAIIKKVINREITQKEAAIKLEITDRQVRRFIVKYNDLGENAFIHKNIKNKNAKKISDDISNEIVESYLNDYSDYGFTHFYEEHGYKYGISFSAMINIFISSEIISSYAQHKTIKLYNESMKNAIREKTITTEKEKLFEKRKQEEFEKHIRKSTLHYSFGQEIQMDATFWIWFGENETALHLAVDKATKKVLFG